MPREEYQQSLDDLRDDVVAMGASVLDQLEDGLAALETTDDELARAVVDGDEAINDRYLELEAECIDLLALQQPVAGDLRFVAASFKILTDLERIGDLATNFGRYALAVDPDRLGRIDVAGIGDAVREQVEAALAAYEGGDPDACRGVVERDDEVDALCQQASDRVVRDLIVREVEDGDAWAVERLMDDVSYHLLTIRDLERVGDHAVNVAARTLYLVESDPELIY